MYKIYDSINQYLYAQGATIDDLIKDWNNRAEDNFSWIMEQEDNKDFFKTVTEKCYRIENLYQIMDIVNNVEVNNLKLHKDEAVYNEI